MRRLPPLFLLLACALARADAQAVGANLKKLAAGRIDLAVLKTDFMRKWTPRAP